MTAPPWLDVLDSIIGACTNHGRPDLVHRLRRQRARLLDPSLRVLVVGEPNQGKSQLVNALVNAPVCAVDDDVSTTVPTVVRHSAQPSAVLVGPSRRTPVPINRIAEPIGDGGAVVAAEVGIPRRLLANGLVLVDAPPGHVPDDADVVVLASEANRELSDAELALLDQVSTWCPEIVVALTKIDLTPRWRDVAHGNRARLAAAGVPATVLPVSATLRLQAADTDDHALNAESGFTDLVERLQAIAAVKPARLAPREAALAVHAAAAQLVTALRAELADPDVDGPRPARDADELRRAATRCQTTLADDFADLTSDLEFDLRDRARRILREIDAAFDTADPSRQWDEFDDWLRAELAGAADANFSWLLQRCQWIADKAAHGFPHQPAAVPIEQDAWGYGDAGELDRPRLEGFSLSQRAFTGLRGSYGGVLMFGLVTSLTIGLPLFNPISLGAGLLFGGKSIHEEGETRLRRRQAAAKAAAQRHVDDFFLRFGKDSRDTVRHIQRGLRDHFAGLAAELQERMTAAAQARTAERERRHREIRAELERLVALHARITGPLEITA